MEKVKRCPFCGAEAVTTSTPQWCWVECSNDDCIVAPATVAHAKMSDAITDWNNEVYDDEGT